MKTVTATPTARWNASSSVPARTYRALELERDKTFLSFLELSGLQ